MKLIQLSREECEKQAADIILNNLDRIREEKGKATLAVPGGRSVSGIFTILAKEKFDWTNIHLFLIDERFDPNQRNFALLDELKDKVTTHEFTGDIPTYETQLRNVGGSFDVILLSSGEDGHVGALFPHKKEIEDQSNYFLELNDSPKPPPHRMTSSPNLLKRSQIGIIVFFGEAKREALENYKNRNHREKECPAKLVQKIKEDFAFTDLK